LPTLAKVIVDKNIAGTEPKMNFIGFAVGNPFTDPIENAYGRYGTFWGRQLIPRPLYDAWDKRCKGMLWCHNDVIMAQRRHCGQGRWVKNWFFDQSKRVSVHRHVPHPIADVLSYTYTLSSQRCKQRIYQASLLQGFFPFCSFGFRANCIAGLSQQEVHETKV
jgi:hypothetical protein